MKLEMKIGETFAIDAPDNHCFGCSPHNERGLGLTFTRTADRVVEIHYTAEAHLCGAPNVVHGGIQATMLDEASGIACRTAFQGEADYNLVTAEFSLRYRRPVPGGVPIVIRGEVDRVEGSNIFVTAKILDAAGEELTLSTARWVRLD